MTYRDRRTARAERLREWASKRQTRATAALATGDKFRGDHAFNFQPGHIPERARLIARTDAAFASMAVADRMAGKADEIDRQADRAIYSDDIDAPARLAAKLAGLETQRDAMKARNAAFRSAHRAELKALSGAYERDLAMPHQGFGLTNLGGTISRTRKRLAELTPAAEPTTLTAGATSACELCGDPAGDGGALCPACAVSR